MKIVQTYGCKYSPKAELISELEKETKTVTTKKLNIIEEVKI